MLDQLQLPKKPHYQKIGANVDFFTLFALIEAEHENCFLLESLGQESFVSRYSVIGFDPQQVLSAREEHLVRHEGSRTTRLTLPKGVNPYTALRSLIPQDVLSRGYAGGLVGYLSYDCSNYFDPAITVKTHTLFDQFRFGIFCDGLVYDKMTGEVFYFWYTQNRSKAIEAYLRALSRRKQVPLARPQVTYLGDTLTRAEHAERVKYVKEKICSGHIFQCEVGFKSEFSVSGNALAIYQRLREVNPSPHMYYLKFGRQRILGASPELLFRLRQGEMETFPLAGAIRRGASAAEDQALARTLLNDPKEIAEHAMLVDLHRNDLGRVAEFGTVKVRTLMDIKKYSHVQHMGSEVAGILRKDHDMFSSLASCFPAGTLTGAPKIEAMRIIDAIEPTARGPYGGGLGHFGFNGNCTFAIPIRSLFICDEYAYAQTCGGNVYDSTPEGEYDEIQRKLAAMKKVLSEFEEHKSRKRSRAA